MRTTTPAKLFPAVLTSLALLLLAPTVAAAAEAPVKEVLSSHIGAEVNKNGTDICSVTLKEECQPGKRTSAPGGFETASGVAVNDDLGSPQYHDLYVTDALTHRVDVLSANGQFVSTFGWEVNETKDKEAGATQEEKNVCTAAETCKPGVPGTAAGQIDAPCSVAIDPANGNVYVAESYSSGERVQEFTAEGQFVGEVGNETFNFSNVGSVLAFGGPEELLYVGEEGRIREFEPDGKFKQEVPLASISTEPGRHVESLAVDPNGDLYLVYLRHNGENVGMNTIYKLDPVGQAIGEFKLSPRRPELETGNPDSYVVVTGLAVDPAGRLAVTEYEYGVNPPFLAYRGALYGIASGHLHLITEFTNPGGTEGDVGVGSRTLAFNDDDELYGTDFYFPEGAPSYADELIRYAPVPVGEPLTGTATCTPGAESETDVTVECALHGEINPWEVTDTKAWFQWGSTTTLGQETPKQSVCTTSCGKASVALSAATIKGLLPNETYYYQAVGEDANVKAPELLVSETTSFGTGLVAPQVVGAPGVSFVKSFSAVMSGELNPENANTRFAFQYAPTQACVEAERVAEHPVTVGECPGVLESGAGQSSEYARFATTLEARGLQPNSGYRYRLVATSENSAKTEVRVGAGPEGAFQTAPAPVPAASSGAASAIGATTATVAGTVNPGGQPAVYTFELGVYDAGDTQYGIVLSAPAGSGAAPVEEALPLSGLQPGTTYAYRIAVASSYGTSYGETMTFTTTGLPAVLVEPTVLPQVPIPAIAFPTETRGATTKTKSAPKKCAKGKKLEHGKCVRSKRKKQAKKAKRSSATRRAHS